MALILAIGPPAYAQGSTTLSGTMADAEGLPIAEDLAAEQLYLYSRSLEDNFVVKNVLRPAGMDLQRVTYLQLTEGILEMVKAGIGASVLPKWSIAGAIASGDVRAIRITKSGVFRKWYAAALSGVPATPFMDEFIRLLIKQGPAAKKVVRRPQPLAS